MRRYKQEWTAADGLNAAIGQGYVLVSPLQLAVMTSRIASGRNLVPSLMFGQPKPLGPALPFTAEQLAVTHDGMFRVVNGHGTAAASRLHVGDITMSGKTGTAQVRRMISRGSVSDWKARDHSLFICYAPSVAPRYAMAVVVEHGGFGASAAAPIARDVMTCLFDPTKAWADLIAMEKTWGGPPAERMAAKYKVYAAQYGVSAPKVGSDAAVEAAMTRSESSETPAETHGVVTDAERGEAKFASPQPAEPAPPPAAEGAAQ
jgi:penicillin-binding protein 2